MNAQVTRSAVVGLIATAAAGCTARPQPTLRVITWNIAHGRGLARSQVGLPRATFDSNLDRIADVLNAERPSVVALQEADGASLWSGNFDHVARLAEASNLPHHYRGAHIDVGAGGIGLNCGTALLADRPLQIPRSRAFTGEPIASKGFVCAEVEFAGRPLIVASVHLHPSDPNIRAQQAAQLVAALADASHALVVMGDLNCEANEPAFQTIVTGLNLRAYRPESGDMPTFPSQNPRLRIDWVLISPELDLLAYHTLKGLESDHCAVSADITRR